MFSDCCCHWTGCLLLQKYEAVLQVHISEFKNRSTRKRDLEKGLIENTIIQLMQSEYVLLM